MIKRNQHFFNFLLILLDILTLILSIALAWWLRFASTVFGEGIITLQRQDYVKLMIFIIPVYLLLFYFFGLYKPYRKQRFKKECREILFADIIGILAVLAFLYTGKSVHFSRYFLASFFVFSVMLMALERGAVRLILRTMRKNGYNLKHIIIVGAGVLGQAFADKVEQDRQLGYHICGYVDDYFPEKDKNGIPILGTTRKMKEILEQNRVDEVIIALPNTSYKRIDEVIDECEYQGVKTQVIPDYFHLIQGSKPDFDELDGIPLINTRYIPLDEPFNKYLKRICDILFSGLGIIILSPLLLVVAMLVKVTSPGPIIYKQVRVGINRKEFEIYKFRSMRNDVPEVGDTVWTTEDDPRKTKFGSFIRKTSIDELPQLFNVFKGDMSLVGPRPERPFYVQKFKDEIPKYMIKHHVRPGMTGWAQVNGWRGDTDLAPRIECDIEYIEHWTFWFDVKILLMTPFSMFKNAY